MQIGLIGAGNMSRRSRAGGIARALQIPLPSAPRRWSPRSGARHSPRTPRWQNRPTWSSSATSRPSWPMLPSNGAPRQGGRLDSRRHAAERPARRLSRQARLPLHSLPARRGPPRRRRAGRRRPSRMAELDAPVSELFAGSARSCVFDDALLDIATGPDVLRPRLRGARRRGPDRRGRATRHPCGAGAELVVADARRYGRAPASTWLRHPGGPQRGRLAGRGRPRAAWTRLERGGLRAAFSEALDAVLRAARRADAALFPGAPDASARTSRGLSSTLI